MTMREQLTESVEHMDSAMEDLQRTAQAVGSFSWQNKVIYNICLAVRRLLIYKLCGR